MAQRPSVASTRSAQAAAHARAPPWTRGKRPLYPGPKRRPRSKRPSPPSQPFQERDRAGKKPCFLPRPRRRVAGKVAEPETGVRAPSTQGQPFATASSAERSPRAKRFSLAPTATARASRTPSVRSAVTLAPPSRDQRQRKPRARGLSRGAGDQVPAPAALGRAPPGECGPRRWGSKPSRPAPSLRRPPLPRALCPPPPRPRRRAPAAVGDRPDLRAALPEAAPLPGPSAGRSAKPGSPEPRPAPRTRPLTPATPWSPLLRVFRTTAGGGQEQKTGTCVFRNVSPRLPRTPSKTRDPGRRGRLWKLRAQQGPGQGRASPGQRGALGAR
ncbi:translation initiation factor IF-2 [Oryctolagus cuniculus]|uniref:translation initiation factor IF-2 n=1 Tax=Oryctolagus cuniculus TaxID=9986 RepID=UPI00387A381A